MTYFWACCSECCSCCSAFLSSFISCKCGSGVLFYHTYSFIDSFIHWFINSFSSIYFTVLRNTTKNSWSVYLLSNHAWKYTLHSSTGPISFFKYTRSLVQVTLHQHSARRKWKKYFRASPAAVTGQWPGQKLWLTDDRTYSSTGRSAARNLFHPSSSKWSRNGHGVGSALHFPDLRNEKEWIVGINTF